MDIIKSININHLDYINKNKDFTIFYLNESTYYILFSKINASCKSLEYKVENNNNKYERKNFKDYIFHDTYKNGMIYVKNNDLTIPWDNEKNHISHVYDQFNSNKISPDADWIDLIEQHDIKYKEELSHKYNIKLSYDSSNGLFINSEKDDIIESDKSTMITYTFGAGIYKVNQQIWLSPNTTIKGANKVNETFKEPLDTIPKLSGKLNEHTIFLTIEESGDNCYNHMDKDECNISKKGKKRNKKNSFKVDKYKKPGFLLNTNVHLSNFLFQGCMINAYDWGVCSEKNIPMYHTYGLAGGGAFELPGCINQQFSSSNDNNGCHYIDNGEPRWSRDAFNGDTGMAINTVTIHDVRVNSLQKNAWKDWPPLLSNVLFWSATNIDAPKKRHSNIKLSNIVSLQTLADGINVQGTVKDFEATNIVVANAGDDTFAVWGGTYYSDDVPAPEPIYIGDRECGHSNYYGPTNVKFTNIFGHQYEYGTCADDHKRPYGTCIGTFGFQGTVDISGLHCIPDNEDDIILPHDTFCANYKGTLNISNAINVNNSDKNIDYRTYKCHDTFCDRK